MASTEAFIVRRLEADDLPAYKQLRDEMLARHPEAFTSDAGTEACRKPEDYRYRLGLDDAEGGHLTLGAWGGSDLLGAIGLERDLRLKVRHIGPVVGMMVRGPQQGRGIGRALLEALVDEARDGFGLELLTLTVTAGNISALRLYERAGFVTFGTLHKALKLGTAYHDKVHMAMYL